MLRYRIYRYKYGPGAILERAAIRGCRALREAMQRLDEHYGTPLPKQR